MLSVALTAFNVYSNRELIPLHYDIFFGIDRIGEPYKALFYPGLAAALLVLNFAFGLFLMHRDKYLSYYLSEMAAFCSVLGLLHLIVLASFT